ncbi:MAG: hypothetical protein ACKN9W_05805 [Methylococcus sp.]
MKINAKLSIIALSMLTEIGFANCDAILSQAMYNITISKSTGVTIATKYFNNCGKDFTSLSDSQLAQAEVEIFGYGSGGGGISRTKREERLTEWCITNKETAFEYKDKLEETRTIYAESVRAWGNCNALASRDVQVEPIVSDNQKIVSYAMRYTGPTTSGVIFFGVMRSGFTCTIKPYDTVLKKVVPFDPKNPPEIGRINTPVHCTRKAAVTRIINGQQYSYLASGNITLQTGSYNVMMSFPEVYDPPLPEAKADALQKQITALVRQAKLDASVG